MFPIRKGFIVDGKHFPSPDALCRWVAPTDEPRIFKRIGFREFKTFPDPQKNPFRCYWQLNIACDFLRHDWNWPDWKIERWVRD